MSNMNNKNKDRLLGMPHGTANGKLRKNIIFYLANLCKLLTCYRCKEQIESVNDLSIEHKEAWQSATDPKESFFDIQNIAFSHLTCNICASDKKRINWEDGKIRCSYCKISKQQEEITYCDRRYAICRLCNTEKKREYRTRTGKR